MVTISLDDVSVRIGSRQVLRKVSARLTSGALVGIIGPNGAGKSTLLRAILGLLPVSGGEVAIDNIGLDALTRREIAKTLAYLPQGSTLHWPLTVERLVALGRLPHLGPLSRLTAPDQAVIESALDRADARDLRPRIATELSGGERARAMLARALAVGARALLVDEPLASLDPAHQLDVMALLRREAAAGTLVLAVLHDLGLAARFCDRLLLLDGGRIVADGAPVEVLSPDRVAAVYGVSIAHFETAVGEMVVPLERL